MKIINSRNNTEIKTLDEWKNEFYHGSKKDHWKDGYSAAETAKAWLFHPPKEFISLFCQNITIKEVYPEYNTSFDKFGGGVRNHDLAIIAKDIQGDEFVICVESKVSESFGNYTVAEYASKKKKERDAGKNSNVPERIELLKSALFSNINDEKFCDVRYQLLTAVAGTLAEAKNREFKKAVFVVLTFLSHDMDSKKHHENQRVYDYFLELISNGTYKIIHDGDLLGPIKVPGNKKYIPNDIDLYFGKVEIKI